MSKKLIKKKNYGEKEIIERVPIFLVRILTCSNF